MTEALAWLVCRGLRPKVVHRGALRAGVESRDPPKKMEVLATERAKEAELLAMLVEHQVQAGACVSLADAPGGAQAAIPGALWCRVRFERCQFGLKCLGERARGTG
eukprot:15437003-Alexandrium_andersonii.AAC.1